MLRVKQNLIVVSMLLYAVNKFPTIEEVWLRFFETNHGQNKGDSAHSHVISHTDDLFRPQLYPVIRFTRSKQPYFVIPMNYKRFMDFKYFSKELCILSIMESET